MSLKNLDNLVKSGQLKVEPFDQLEFKGLLSSAQNRFKDAKNTTAKSLDILIKRIREAIELCLEIEDRKFKTSEFIGIQRIAI